MILRRFLGMVCLLILIASCVPDTCISYCTAVVTTSKGKVQGTDLGKVREFWGIPYAQPVWGNNRWKAPKEKPAWSGVFYAAEQKKKHCVQWSQPTSIFGWMEDEDCLAVNIWAPDKPGTYPVMVWLHGGGLVLGSGSETSYEARNLARDQDVVVVTVNYRLGPMGFLALPELTAEQGQSGNYGLLDQVAALNWVKNEIAAFGGDPNNITVFGESAGAISTCMLMASPLSRDLFQHAMIASGPCTSWSTLSLAEAEAYGVEFANSMGCTNSATRLSCLRSLDYRTIKNTLNAPTNELFKNDDWKFFPHLVIDGYVLTDDLITMLASSPVRQDVMIGVVKDEGQVFEALRDHPVKSGYADYLAERYPGYDVPTLQSLYPISDYANVGAAMSEIKSDDVIKCPTVKLSDALANLGYDVYQYEFRQDADSILKGIINLQLGENGPQPLGVLHSSDVPFIFNLSGPTGDVATPNQKEVAIKIQNYLGNFALTGAPSVLGQSVWPQYNSTDKEYLEWDIYFGIESHYRQEACAYWNSL